MIKLILQPPLMYYKEEQTKSPPPFEIDPDSLLNDHPSREYFFAMLTGVQCDIPVLICLPSNIVVYIPYYSCGPLLLRRIWKTKTLVCVDYEIPVGYSVLQKETVAHHLWFDSNYVHVHAGR